MQLFIEQAENVYDTLIEKGMTHLGILNALNIIHAFGLDEGVYNSVDENRDQQFSPNEPTTKFLIYTKIFNESYN
jgi:hypothetical protein|tara:strand:- start:2176 stop:2400 length:225 start_codon:yes stop_codon:yes gene_type:complete